MLARILYGISRPPAAPTRYTLHLYAPSRRDFAPGADFAPPPSVPRRPMAKRRKNKNAAPALRPVLLQPDQAGGPSAKEEKPIIAEKHWPALPLWIALHAERGPIRKCWSGHRLFRVPQDGRRYKRCEIRGCGVQPAAGSAVMACPQCRWMVAQT